MESDPDSGATRPTAAILAGIVGNSLDAIVAIDHAHRITIFNDTAELTFGYSRHEVLGSPFEILLPERFRAIHREHVDHFAAGPAVGRRMVVDGVLLGRRKNGDEFRIEAAISKLEIGAEIVLAVSLRDVSELQRAEGEDRLLAELGKVLITAGADEDRLLADVAHVIVRDLADWCIVDLVDHGELRRRRVVHIDPAKAEVCAALERHGPTTIIATAAMTQRATLVDDVTPNYFEALAKSSAHLDGLRALDLGSFIIAPLVARGQTLGTLGLGASRGSRRYRQDDVRLIERMAASVALALDNARLHQQVARAVHARDEVLGMVVHDLRSPLNVINLELAALRRRAVEPEHVTRIQHAVGRMNGMIQDLLDVARLEAGQLLTIVKATVTTAGVIADVVEQHEAALATGDLHLWVEVEAGLPDLWADGARILQVFDNLIGNATKFAREGITIGAAIGNDRVRFWVADDGPGIPPEVLPRIFDRFWQAERADRRGAGLGLSIVKAIIDAHGGQLWVESRPGTGATFHFTLPVAPG